MVATALKTATLIQSLQEGQQELYRGACSDVCRLEGWQGYGGQRRGSCLRRQISCSLVVPCVAWPCMAEQPFTLQHLLLCHAFRYPW